MSPALMQNTGDIFTQAMGAHGFDKIPVGTHIEGSFSLQGIGYGRDDDYGDSGQCGILPYLLQYRPAVAPRQSQVQQHESHGVLSDYSHALHAVIGFKDLISFELQDPGNEVLDIGLILDDQYRPGFMSPDNGLTVGDFYGGLERIHISVNSVTTVYKEERKDSKQIIKKS